MGYLVGNADAQFSSVKREWCIDFLPYAPDSEIERIIGYPNPNKWHGYGSWAEFYVSEAEARARFEFLRTSGAVERAELLRGPRGSLVDSFEHE